MAVETTAGHAQYKFSLHFITGTHTTKTIDAFGKIGSHVRMTEIFFPVQMIFSFGITNITDANSCCNGLQFAIIIYFAGKAIKRMICKHQFNNIPAKSLYPF